MRSSFDAEQVTNQSLTHLGWDKIVVILQQFQTHVFQIFIRILSNLSQVSNSQWISDGSDNGLVLIRWKAIIWTSDLSHWCIYVSLNLNEFKVELDFHWIPDTPPANEVT